MSSPTANEATVREAVRAIIAHMPIDRIIGQPTNASLNNLKQQIAKIAAAVKTTKWGGRHGHLALVLNNAEYQAVTGVATITTDRLPPPPIVPDGLTNNTTLTHRTRIMADHNLECQEFWKQEAVDAIVVDKIVREAIEPTYVEELDDDYIGYSAQTIKTIITHLRSEWCIITTLEKKQAAAAFHIQWDFTSHITKYARELDKRQKECRDIGVPAADATKIQYYVESMYASDMFDEKEMQAWEIKPSNDKTWDNAKNHFVLLYKSKEKFNAEREARTGGYESTNSLYLTGTMNPNIASASSHLTQADHTTVMDYTTNLESALNSASEHAAAITHANNDLLTRLDTQQKLFMDHTNKFMTMLATTATNTATQQPIATNTRTRRGARHTRGQQGTLSQKPAMEPRFCNSCKKNGVFHADDDCFSLKKNRDKRPQWYVARM